MEFRVGSGYDVHQLVAGRRLVRGGHEQPLEPKAFAVLALLARSPGRVFTRAQLLQEVWGYDFFGGTRTVDVHVRRLRAKLGPEYEALIGTVRNVGYKAVRPARGRAAPAEAASVTAGTMSSRAVISARICVQSALFAPPPMAQTVSVWHPCSRNNSKNSRSS